ncbi:hypothetical protein VTN31DRAFT_2120 [Thermomyces dupontii]|uniref:uncharacterized protein n=1 Tax=Talaromyces thermophilus TaxID=28565 RepID=UPI0037431850
MPSRPQYLPNTLRPIAITKDNLLLCLQELQSAIKQGVNILQENVAADEANSGSIYSGTTGIALALLRLERQKQAISGTNDGLSGIDFAGLAFQLMPVAESRVQFVPGRMSPVGSALGPPFLRILAACEDHNLGLGRGLTISSEDASVINEAVRGSLKHGPVTIARSRPMGADEVLYGRAGLLWALLTLQRHASEGKAKAMVESALKPAFASIPELVRTIVEAGIQGSRDYAKVHGAKNALPLMWPWTEDRCGLGAVHGAAGILNILLSCDPSTLQAGKKDSYLDLIAQSITGLCRVCIANGGHLPTSLPPKERTGRSPLVQLCHGAPGLLLLLSTAMRNDTFMSMYWQPEWDEAIRLGTEKVWQEGVLSKGGSLCHGFTGNAWPFLGLHDACEYHSAAIEAAKNRSMRTASVSEGTLTADFFLSRALPFMLLTRESPPYSVCAKVSTTYDFRMPDRPFSLFEGLAGELCAWAETCAVIRAGLRKMELEDAGQRPMSEVSRDEIFGQFLSQQLELPAFAVNGPGSNLQET